MKPYHFTFLPCLVLLTLFPAVLPAVETLKLKPVLYLFRSIEHIDFRDALRGSPPLSGDGIVFTQAGQPATVIFDQEKLVLNGGNYTWNGGSKVPPQFNATELPAIITPTGQSATIQCDVPIQYLEKMPDGSLQVREVSRDSTELPHYRLTLTVRPDTNAKFGYDLVVLCQMDIAAVQGREKIPGVELEVGRPIVSRFDNHVEFWTKSGEWSGLMAGTKASGDYTLLLLLKVSPVDTSSTSSARPMQAIPPPK
jgi:hypothetical protein